MDENHIKVKVFATLRRYAPPEQDRPVAGRTAIADLVSSLGIPADEITVIFLNGRHAEADTFAGPGDTVSLFPPVGGG